MFATMFFFQLLLVLVRVRPYLKSDATKRVPYFLCDHQFLNFFPDGSDNEDGGSTVMESTTISSSRGKGAKTSARGTTKRGRGSRGGTTGSSSGRGRATSKRALPAGMTALNLSMIAASNSTVPNFYQ